MLKAAGIMQLAIAPLFVVPAITGSQESSPSLEDQLEATVNSIEYLTGLRDSVRAGAEGSVTAVLAATEAPRETSPRRAERLTGLSNDIARLRFDLDKLLASPSHVDAIMSLPQTVIQALGLGGAERTALDVNLQPSLEGQPGTSGAAGPVQLQSNGEAGSAAVDPKMAELERAMSGAQPTATDRSWAGAHSTVGLDDAMRSAIRSNVGPLDQVASASRRRGQDPVPLEDDGYVADPMRLGKLLVRSGRAVEAIEILQHEEGPGAAYWLARAYQDQGRSAEALALFRALASDEEAGVFRQHAQHDLTFLEFHAEFERSLQR